MCLWVDKIQYALRIKTGRSVVRQCSTGDFCGSVEGGSNGGGVPVSKPGSVWKGSVVLERVWILDIVHIGALHHH